MENKYLLITQQIEKLILNSKKINLIKRLLLESENLETKTASIIGLQLSEISLAHLKNSLIRKKNEHLNYINNAARLLLHLFDISYSNFSLESFVLGTKDLLNGYAEIEDFDKNLWALSLNTGEFTKINFSEDEESKELLPDYIKEPCSVLPENDEYLILIKSNNR